MNTRQATALIGPPASTIRLLIEMQSPGTSQLPSIEQIHWSSDRFSELEKKEVEQILEICSQGWILGKADTGRLHTTSANPFSQKFMGGIPFILWDEDYRRGMVCAKANKPNPFTLVKKASS